MHFHILNKFTVHEKIDLQCMKYLALSLLSVSLVSVVRVEGDERLCIFDSSGCLAVPGMCMGLFTRGLFLRRLTTEGFWYGGRVNGFKVVFGGGVVVVLRGLIGI